MQDRPPTEAGKPPILLILAGCAVLILAVCAYHMASGNDTTARNRTAESTKTDGRDTGADKTASTDGTPERLEDPAENPPPSRLEMMKAMDREHLKAIHKGLFAYKEKYGHFPEYLSQLAPEFITPDTLNSPRRAEDGRNEILSTDHPDPGKQEPSYGYEFSNLVFRDGRTFAQIKEVQRSEWGDAVPILRAFGYDKVINMSYGGDLYETELNWEWDPATLDVVQARGWGAGLTEGQFTQVQVLGSNGQPLPNAQVWADGRNYSFDLPNRPFTTDAQGIARIPLGTDLNRTNLTLRAEGDGVASTAIAFPKGTPPDQYQMTVSPSTTVGGQIVDSNGKPVANTWVYLKSSDESDNTPAGLNLGAVKTDAEGHWKANLSASDASAFNLHVGSGEQPGKFSKGEPVDATAAGKQQAVTTVQQH